MPTALNRIEAIPALTGLRFFAALMVFFSHYPIAGVNDSFSIFFASGYSGVTFFFVLSGFIIAYNYSNRFEISPVAETPKYLWARFSRVYPVYFITMAFVWFLQGADGPILIYLFALQAWHPDIPVIGGLNSPAWSISVEFFLYISFPFIMVFFTKIGIMKSKFRIIGLAILFVIVQFSLAAYLSLPPRNDLAISNPDSAHRWLYNFPLFRVFDFGLGVLAAIFFCRHAKSGDKKPVWRLISLVSIAAVFLIMTSKDLFYSAYSWDAAYALVFALLIFSLAMDQKSLMSLALSNKKIVFLGESSFAFYMIHLIARPIFDSKVTGSLLTNIAFELFFLGLIITMSIGLHLAVEKPCRDYLNGIIRIGRTQKAKTVAE
ncbi:acyltransferase family protein [Pseudomonas vancouverensis]|nr:acyltransferase [Pseudomonas vancouverensis]SDU97136.1 Peptidoglycan/LPS O-acetylase OafA/YrhL, contains acyltransferase and SGNH-hydrolase domains [Pseudomonas vancouverensis]